MMKTYKRADWIANTNIYEVNIRQYSAEGSFTAFVRALPRLQDMGVEVLWLMPIHPIGKINRKGTLGSYYSISDFKAVNPEFGTAEDFKNLVEQAHGHGMKVIMDWVANHAAWDNVWTSNHPDYFERDEAGNFKPPYDWTDVIQINHSNAAEQEAMIEAMQYWVTEFDIDGFRADLAHLTPLEFWHKARTAVEPLKPDLFWLAESEEISYHQVFDCSFTWEWMHRTENFYTGNSNLSSLYEVLAKYVADFPPEAHRMYFTSNHDENSWNGTAAEKYGDMVKLLSVFNCTWNGIPLIYSGEEIPNMKRLQFFDKDAIEWNETYAMHDFYKTLLTLRKTNPALRSADAAVATFKIATDATADVMAYLRKHDEHEVLVFLNFSTQPITATLQDSIVDGWFRNIFDKTEARLEAGRAFNLPGHDFLVFERISAK